MLAFAEGFDDYANPTDFALSAALATGVTAVTGRNGSGIAARITGASGILAYGAPSGASGTQIYAGFAMEATGIDGAGAVAKVAIAGGNVALFSVVQASPFTLLFFDVTNQLTATAFGPSIDLITGLLGSAVYRNFGSYVEVHLITGNPGTVTVVIDGAVAFTSTTANLAAPLSSTLTVNNIGPGATSISVAADLGQTVPFLFRLNGGVANAVQIVGRCTAKSGTGNVVWTCDPLPAGSYNFTTGQPVLVYPPTGTTIGAVAFECAANLETGTPVLTIDDFYWCDQTGAQNNNFLGNTRILSQAPSGDGVSLQWTPSSGTAHWSLVNAYPINYGATQVTATAAAEIDCYTYPNLPVLGAFTILRALQVALYCESEGGGGANSITGVVNIAGTSYPGSAQSTPAVWQRIATIFELDPATAAAWTGANVNAAQVGEKRTA